MKDLDLSKSGVLYRTNDNEYPIFYGWSYREIKHFNLAAKCLIEILGLTDDGSIYCKRDYCQITDELCSQGIKYACDITGDLAGFGYVNAYPKLLPKFTMADKWIQGTVVRTNLMGHPFLWVKFALEYANRWADPDGFVDILNDKLHVIIMGGHTGSCNLTVALSYYELHCISDSIAPYSRDKITTVQRQFDF